MLAFVLFLIVVAVVFGLVGALVHGLIWLLAIGCAVFVLAVLVGGFRLGRRTRRRVRR